MDKAIEQQARELLAELILTVRPRAALWPLAKANRVKAVWRESCIDAWMRHGYDTGATPLYSPEQVERIIARAVTRPAPSDEEVERLRGALEECHALSVERWRRLLAAEAENKRLREALDELRERLSALDSHAPPRPRC